MGADLFDRFPDWTAEADSILGYGIRDLCLNDPRAELGQTAFTQPALFVVNALTYRARLEDGHSAPDFVAGHSLGEYNALLAAGVFDFATGLRLVQRRGALMGTVSGGGMAAVIGLGPDGIRAILAASDAGRRLDVANFNSQDQTVIAGPVEDLAAVKPAFEAAGVRLFVPLKVSAPFHSRYMKASMDEFSRFLAGFTLAPPALSVIANVTGRPYESDLHGVLGSQIGHSVRWLDSIEYLLDHQVTEFEEVGPGNVLTKLTNQIKKGRR